MAKLPRAGVVEMRIDNLLRKGRPKNIADKRKSWTKPTGLSNEARTVYDLQTYEIYPGTGPARSRRL